MKDKVWKKANCGRCDFYILEGEKTKFTGYPCGSGDIYTGSYKVKYGQCRLNPPQAIGNSYSAENCMYPEVYAKNEACSYYKRR